MAPEPYDAVVVGSGPNGLAAAITLVEAGRSVVVLEARRVPGGGLRTEELLEPGFRHDVCSTIMALPPLLDLFQRLGLDLVTPPAPLAHPFDDGTAAVVARSVDETALRLGYPGYTRIIGRLVAHIRELLAIVMRPPRLPRDLGLAAQFGRYGVLPATVLARWFGGLEARAVLAGAAATACWAWTSSGPAPWRC
jgi:phytoene dehydrogenase-like protein